MECGPLTFLSLADAIAALHHAKQPLVLTRFTPDPAARVVIAVNAAAAAIGTVPAPGEHPDWRRDRSMTADIELQYLYRQLVERGHAQQVLSMVGGHFVELNVRRVEIAGDSAVYGFVNPKLKA